MVLLITSDVKPGLLRALKPWVHDYLTSPVLREAAAARIKNALRARRLEQTARRATRTLEGWLSKIESAMKQFKPLSFDRSKTQDELAARILRGGKGQEDKSGPAYLLTASPDGKQGLLCDLYAPHTSGTRNAVAGFTIPESTVFLSIRSGNGLICINRFGRGRCRGEYRHAFPPELVQATGPIWNLAGSFHAGGYVVALNYGRRVTEEDALLLRGFALPGSFLGSVAGEVQDVSDSFLVLTRALALAADSPGDNGAHVLRMNEYAKTLARQLSLPARFIETISYSAQLHDVGKIYIHPDLLEKPLRLTAREFDLVKQHPLFGARILGDSPLLRVAKNIALTHHECWDGSGYPSGLSGNAIPIEGAIVKIADVYDALRAMHTYKSSNSHEDACRFILDGGGDGFHEIRPAHFHPDVLRAFRSIAGKFEEIYHSN
jgi:response regulator RpfG family c-di-GMP phosphodiesterase